MKVSGQAEGKARFDFHNTSIKSILHSLDILTFYLLSVTDYLDTTTLLLKVTGSIFN